MPYYFDGAIAAGTNALSCIVYNENSPPTQTNWGGGDDTLTRQGGHGICKGLATAWVIALLNGERGARDAGLFRSYFTNVLKFQGTYIKDFGKHMDTHVRKLEAMGQSTHLKLIKQRDKVNLHARNLPNGNWGCYVSVWKHDVAFGHYGHTYFIMDPNCGLIGFRHRRDFLTGANALIEGRRARKNKGPNDTVGLWFFRKKFFG